MGLFDGQIKKLGNKLADGFESVGASYKTHGRQPDSAGEKAFKNQIIGEVCQIVGQVIKRIVDKEDE